MLLCRLCNRVGWSAIEIDAGSCVELRRLAARHCSQMPLVCRGLHGSPHRRATTTPVHHSRGNETRWVSVDGATARL